MTKKQKKAQDSKHRVLVPFNTGTRTHKSPKDYDRKRLKKELRDLDDWVSFCLFIYFDIIIS